MTKIKIHHWPQADLPSAWTGQPPVHITPVIEEYHNNGIRSTRQMVLALRIRMKVERRHYHLYINDKLEINSASLI